MIIAGIKVVDTPLVHDAIELTRNSSEPYPFDPVLRNPELIHSAGNALSGRLSLKHQMCDGKVSLTNSRLRE